jgi:hypothetical protein
VIASCRAGSAREPSPLAQEACGQPGHHASGRALALLKRWLPRKKPSQFGVLVMKAPLSRRFYLEPQQPLHRRAEAWRAVGVDPPPQTAVAECLGYTSTTMRRLVRDVRAQCRANQGSPFPDPAVRTACRTTSCACTNSPGPCPHGGCASVVAVSRPSLTHPRGRYCPVAAVVGPAAV